jgi:hypothetical protein
MNRHLIELPPPEVWPDPEELVGRKELAALLQIPVETVRFWERTGLMPPRAALPARGVLRDYRRVLWRGSDLAEWREKMRGIIFARPPKPRRGMRWVAGTGWVEPPQAPPSPRRSSKIPGRHLAVLTRLEGQLAALPPDLEPDPVEPPQPPRRPEPEPVAFASNVVRSRARPGGYW